MDTNWTPNPSNPSSPQPYTPYTATPPPAEEKMGREMNGHMFLPSHILSDPFSYTAFGTFFGLGGGNALRAAVLGGVTGLIAIRRQGIYFAMITLAFAQMVYFFCVQAPFTHGEDGLQGITRKPLLGGLIPTKDDRVLYYVVLVIFLFGFGTIYRIIHSPFGQVLKAIRDNEQRALSLGYEADRYKLLAFVLSAAIAGLAGSTKAMVLQFATLTDVSAAMSGEVVLMALVGGLGTITGPIVGAFIIITMQNYLASFGEFVLVIQGAIFVVIVMAFRRGLVGEVVAFWKSRRKAA